MTAVDLFKWALSCAIAASCAFYCFGLVCVCRIVWRSLSVSKNHKHT
jgi:hypothetical protein